MTEEERAAAREAFTAKNERRREARGMWPRADAAAALVGRRDVGGAFGKASNAEWNRLIPGTTGATR